MKRLLYISTARTPMTGDELAGVLRTSRRNNGAVDVTGLLVVGGRRFLQVLEGPDLSIATTFKRISADPRHYAVVSLASESIDARYFAEWSMGCVTGGNADNVAAPANAVAQMIAPITDPTLRAYFTGFVQTHMAA